MNATVTRRAGRKVSAKPTALNREAFTKTATAKLYKSNFGNGYALELQGPHAHELPGCSHLTDFQPTVMGAIYEAITFCDSKGIRIMNLAGLEAN